MFESDDLFVLRERVRDDSQSLLLQTSSDPTALTFSLQQFLCLLRLNICHLTHSYIRLAPKQAANENLPVTFILKG